MFNIVTIICYGICAGCGILLPFGLKYFIQTRNKKQKEIISPTPFVLSEYYERMEKVSLEIQEEQEKQEKYHITLWWGLDGLQLYDDGTTRWISRRKQEPVNQNISYTPCQCTLPQEIQTFNGYDIQQASVDERIKYINTMIQQELQAYQIFNPYSQKYIPFSCPPAYATSICNCYSNQYLGGLTYERNTCQLC